MIHYKHGLYGLGLFFKLKGSVLPKAALVAIPPTIVAVLIRALIPEFKDAFESSEIGRMYNTFIWVLGIVLVFRTSQAYARYWEGAQMLETVYSDFFDACACIVNFSQTSKQSQSEILAFQNTCVRLFSLLHCCALQQTTVRQDDSFEVIDMEGMDQSFLDELTEIEGRRQRTEVVSQWILRLVLEAMESHVIPTPAPIVSRIFQEINSGMISVNRMSTITSTPFPFPYAQMIAILLTIMSVVTPAYIGALPIRPFTAGAFAFLSVSSLWCLNLIAAEIEQPFGDDHNDFDIHMTQREMNRSLLLLLGKQFRALPPMTPRRPNTVKPLKRCFTDSTFKSDVISQKSSTQSLSLSDIGKRSSQSSQPPAVLKHQLISESEMGLDRALQEAEMVAKQNASRSTHTRQAEATDEKLNESSRSNSHQSTSSLDCSQPGGSHTSTSSTDPQMRMQRSFSPDANVIQSVKGPTKMLRLQESVNEDRSEERLQELCSEIHSLRQAICQLSEHIQISGSCSAVHVGVGVGVGVGVRDTSGDQYIWA